MIVCWLLNFDLKFLTAIIIPSSNKLIISLWYSTLILQSYFAEIGAFSDVLFILAGITALNLPLNFPSKSVKTGRILLL